MERKADKKQSLKDRAQEFLQGVAEAVESLFPQPQLMPVPVRVRGTSGHRGRGRR